VSGPANDNPERIAYTIKEACALTGLGQTTVFAMLNDGRLRRVKIGTRTLIPRSSLVALFEQDGEAA